MSLSEFHLAAPPQAVLAHVHGKVAGIGDRSAAFRTDQWTDRGFMLFRGSAATDGRLHYAVRVTVEPAPEGSRVRVEDAGMAISSAVRGKYIAALLALIVMVVRGFLVDVEEGLFAAAIVVLFLTCERWYRRRHRVDHTSELIDYLRAVVAPLMDGAQFAAYMRALDAKHRARATLDPSGDAS